MPFPRAKLTGLLISELSAVDKGAQGKQPTVVLKRAPVAANPPNVPVPTSVTKATFQRIVKQAVLTDEVDGHQHTIDLDDVGRWYEQLTTSYQTSEGADCGHSHAWVFDKDSGSITIAADSGHSHTVDAVVPANLIAYANARETLRAIDTARGTAELGAEVLSSAVNAAASGSVNVTVVAQRAVESNSPPTTPIRSVEKHQEPPMSDTTIRKVLAAALSMSEEQRAYASTLDADAQVVFVEKSSIDRDVIVKAALDADPVIHTMTDGTAIRKSAGLVAISLAKQADAQAKIVAEQATQIEKSRAENERITLHKRAESEIGHLAGETEIKVSLLKALGTITDEKERNGAIAILKSANAIAKAAGQPLGTTEEADPAVAGNPDVAYSNLEKGLVEFAKKQSISKVWTEGLAAFEKTPEGAALVVAYQSTGA